MKTVKPNVLEYMMRGLKKYAISGTVDIPVWESVTGMYLGDGEYSRDPAPPEIMRLGDRWEASYDCARWFKATVKIPPVPPGQELYFEADFGGEALVKINGKITGAVSSGWVNRDRIFLDTFEAGETAEIEMEYTVDSGSFCDDAMDGAKSVLYTMNKARLVIADPVCEAYLFDTQIVWEALANISDEYIKARVFEALDESVHRVDFDFDDARVRRSIAEAAEILREKLAKIPHTPQAQIYMTGHSHIDIAWLWRVQETQRKAARTFSNNLALMDRYPDFVFAQSQAILYDTAKRLYPELYERIKQKVASGQWDIEGNVWVEADTNIASGEALIRQLLYGREFFKKEFGVVSDIYWLPDCFGFSWALPQIIKRSGMKYFITSKLAGQDTNRFPHTTFRWKGNDGSEVIAHMQRMTYGGEFSPAQLVQAAKENDQKDITDKAMGMFGYGDGGGGCTYAMMERGRRLRNFPGLPATKIGHASEFFENVSRHAEDLPVYNDEMYYENHRGTYTSQAFIKKYNRKGELLLTRTEMACVFAGAAGHLFSTEALEEAWKLLLKNQFHDILPGTSIHEAHEDCHEDYSRMTALGEVVKEGAIKHLNTKIAAEENSVVVWNFLSHPVTAPAKAVFESPFEDPAVFDDGKQLPCTVLCREEEKILVFMAEDVPAMGYKVFKIGKRQALLPTVTASPRLLKNGLLKVSLDEDGIITSIFDKKNGREVLRGQGNLLTIFQDKCVHETAWNLELNYQIKFWELKSAKSIRVMESNELRGIIRIERVFNKSTIIQDIILYTESDRLDFKTYAQWYESDKLLKAAFDVDIHSRNATFEIAHGALERPTHWSNSFDLARFEQCGHKWADLSEGDYGVSLLNDCKYGYDIKDNVMRLSLLRAPTCPDRTADQGTHRFTYSLYPHKGGWREGGSVQKAFELNLPLEAFILQKQEGPLPGKLSFLSADVPNVIIDTVKPAQNGDGIILRVYESSQCRGKVNISSVLPFERVTECNLMEENERDIPTKGKSFAFDIKPFEVKTFRLR